MHIFPLNLKRAIRLLVIGAASLAAAARANVQISQQGFAFVGGDQTYTVPAGTDYLIVRAWGAGGGGGTYLAGGQGAFVRANVPAAPGASVTVRVAGGGSGFLSGGWPGGGRAQGFGGSGGGGYTYVHIPGNSEIFVGGGGGGGNGDIGGDGGPNGSSGAGVSNGGGNAAGGGGSQSGGGYGGLGDGGGGLWGVYAEGAPGGPDVAYVGGGGGGGYYGGGGGGSGNRNGGWGGGGGGGGSSVATGNAYSVTRSYAMNETGETGYPGGYVGGWGAAVYGSGGNGYVYIEAWRVSAPTGTVGFSANPIAFGQSSVVTSNVSQVAGATLTSHWMLWDQGNASYWTGPGYLWNFNSVAGMTAFGTNAQTGVPNGPSGSTKTITIRPALASTFQFLSFSNNSSGRHTAWAVGGASTGALVVNRAVPTSVFAAATKYAGSSSNYIVIAGDLNASFTNPFSAAVAPPSGSLTYRISPLSPNGIANSAVVAGTQLAAGLTYIVRATLAGDANYFGSEIDSTWTISKDPTGTVGFSANPIAFGQSSVVTSNVSQVAGATLTSHWMLWDQGNASHWTGPGYVWNFNSVAGMTAFGTNAQNGVPNGPSESTKTITIRPALASTFQFLSYSSNSLGGTPAWAHGGASTGALVVNRAVPTSVFAAATKSPGSSSNYIVIAGDLNASFTNPFSAAVAPPSGSLTYRISPLSPNGIANSAVVAGTQLAAGLTYIVRATLAGDANYFGSEIDSTWTISKATQFIAFANPGAQAFNTTFGLAGTTTSGLPITWGITSGPAFLTGNTLSFTGTGNVQVAANQEGNATWEAAAQAVQLFTVSAAPTVFSITPVSFPFTGRAQGPVISPNPGFATYSTSGTLSAVNVGSYSVTATGSGNFTGTSVATAWSISQGAQSLTFANPGSQTFGTPMTLVGSSSAGLAVSWSVTSGPATVAGNFLTFTGAGTVAVAANQSGNGNFSAAPTVSQSFTVNPQPTAFTISPIEFTFNGLAQGPVFTAYPGGATFATAGTPNAINAGSYTAIATANGNYSGANSTLNWTISPRPQSIAFADPGTIQALIFPLNVALTATSSSGLGIAYAVISGPATVSGTALTVTGAGTVTVRASQAGNSNNLAASSVTKSFLVQQLFTLTVNAGPGGTTTSSGAFAAGTAAPIGATPNATFSFGSWSGSVVASPNAAATSITMNANSTVTANFVAGSWSITAGAGVGGSASGSGSASNGSVATLSATPISGYRFGSWSGADAALLSNTSIPNPTVTVTKNINVTANFVQTFRLTANSSLGGTTSGSGTYDTGSSVSVGVVASTGYIFAGWGGANSVLLGNVNSASTTITMLGDYVVNASMSALAAAVNAGSLDLGSAVISSGPAGNRRAERDVTLTLVGNASSVAITGVNVDSLPAPGEFYVAVSAPTSVSASGGTVTVGFSPSTTLGTRTGTLQITSDDPITPIRFYSLTGVAVKSPQSIAFGVVGTKTFGDAPFAPTASATSSLPLILSIVSGPATTNGTTITLTGAGTVVVAANQVGNGIWDSATQVIQTFTVNRWPTTFAVSSAGFTFNGIAQAPTIVTTPSIATFTLGGTLSATNAGAYLATATATGNYIGTNSTLSWVINKANQTIALANPGTQQMDSGSVAIVTSATSGLAVTTLVTSGPATFSGSTVNFTGFGDVSVTASQPGNSNWNAATSVSQSFYVNGNPTITQAILSSANAVLVTNTVANGIASNGAGTATVFYGQGFKYQVSGTDPGSTLANLYLRLQRPGGVLGATNPDVTTLADLGGTWGNTVGVGSVGSASVTTAVILADTIGDWPIWGHSQNAAALDWVAGWDGQRFGWQSANNFPVLRVAKATPSGTYTSATKPAGASINYIATAADLSATFANPYSAVVSAPSGAISYTISPASANGVVNSSVTAGTAFTAGLAYIVSATIASDANYLGAVVSSTWTISKATQTVAFVNPGAQTYGTNLSLAGSSTSGLGVTWSIASGPATVSGNVVSFTGVGTVVVAANQVGNGNYFAATTVSQSFTVNRANLTITANAAVKVYGASNPTFSFTPTGFVNSDTSAVLSGAPSLTTSANTLSGVGGYTVNSAIGTLSAANYSFTFVAGTLTVTRAPTTTTVSASVAAAILNRFTTDAISIAGNTTSDVTAITAGTPTYTVSYSQVTGANHVSGSSIASGFVIGGTVTNVNGSADTGAASTNLTITATWPTSANYLSSTGSTTIAVQNPTYPVNVQAQAVPVSGFTGWLTASAVNSITVTATRPR